MCAQVHAGGIQSLIKLLHHASGHLIAAMQTASRSPWSHDGLKMVTTKPPEPLVSVAGLCDANNVVIVHTGGGFIHPLTSKKRVRLARAGNAYVLDMVAPPAAAEEETGGLEEAAAAFRRQE